MKFKFRLGCEEHVFISGKRYDASEWLDTFNCRVTVRCGALQASGHSDFTTDQLQSFIHSLVYIVRDLQGQCELVPTSGQVSLRVAVTNTGKIATDVEFRTLSSSAIAFTGWNATARIHSDWSNYYKAVDVACLNVPRLRMLDGHTPIIENNADPGE